MNEWESKKYKRTLNCCYKLKQNDWTTTNHAQKKKKKLSRFFLSFFLCLTAAWFWSSNRLSFPWSDCICRFVQRWLTCHSVLNLSCHRHKSLFNICCVLGWGFNVWHPNFISKCLGSVVFHHAFRSQIWFVSHQQFVHTLVCISINLIQPLFDVVEAFLISDVENDNDAVCAAVVAASDCAETFLACSVPLLKREKEKNVSGGRGAVSWLLLLHSVNSH